MKNKGIFLAGLGLCLLVVFFMAQTVWGITFPNPSKINSIPDLLDAIINFLYTMSFPVLTGVMLYAGFVMLTSAGNATKFNQGITIIIYGAIGFLVVLFSKGIIIVIQQILQ